MFTLYSRRYLPVGKIPDKKNYGNYFFSSTVYLEGFSVTMLIFLTSCTLQTKTFQINDYPLHSPSFPASLKRTVNKQQRVPTPITWQSVPSDSAFIWPY